MQPRLNIQDEQNSSSRDNKDQKSHERSRLFQLNRAQAVPQQNASYGSILLTKNEGKPEQQSARTPQSEISNEQKANNGPEDQKMTIDNPIPDPFEPYSEADRLADNCRDSCWICCCAAPFVGAYTGVAIALGISIPIAGCVAALSTNDCDCTDSDICTEAAIISSSVGAAIGGTAGLCYGTLSQANNCCKFCCNYSAAQANRENEEKELRFFHSLDNEGLEGIMGIIDEYNGFENPARDAMFRASEVATESNSEEEALIIHNPRRPGR